MAVHLVAQKFDAGDAEDALVHVEEQAVVLQSAKDLLEMMQVLLRVLAADENIIKVAEVEGAVEKNSVDHPLESHPGILEAEGHPPKFEETEGGDDGRFGHVRGVHGDLVIPFDKVKSGKNLAFVKNG